ncbi:uncharacterized protein LACBIDRAFT_308704 [Laccaria bicolor S238N-H82]|uniref:Predicted protein n=1 Tax=Laccaria bicolor (strain S238N-H82 / ATCC MYA-4686) TaxID=486041 RepID=B0CX01_LACBS|nr:uncharacterized protein LACBIDRAFT_308704 [Laccaria bicolor S238N-H82]EDR13160.1 predicted protein [Laccaria bicolor S238N-H82]|eukprot:XP_001875658.1 predicted protein [Laccaria bicolor S238N-H82]
MPSTSCINDIGCKLLISLEQGPTRTRSTAKATGCAFYYKAINTWAVQRTKRSV